MRNEIALALLSLCSTRYVYSENLTQSVEVTKTVQKIRGVDVPLTMLRNNSKLAVIGFTACDNLELTFRIEPKETIGFGSSDPCSTINAVVFEDGSGEGSYHAIEKLMVVIQAEDAVMTLVEPIVNESLGLDDWTNTDADKLISKLRKLPGLMADDTWNLDIVPIPSNITARQRKNYAMAFTSKLSNIIELANEAKRGIEADKELKINKNLALHSLKQEVNKFKLRNNATRRAK